MTRSIVYPKMRAARLGALLTELRRGERNAYQLADLICLNFEHTRVYYLNTLIAEGKIHIARAAYRGEGNRSSAYPVYAFGPHDDKNLPLCHKAQLAAARSVMSPAIRDFSLKPLLDALSYEDLTCRQLSAKTNKFYSETKYRLDHLVTLGEIHVAGVSQRFPGDRRGLFLYSLGSHPQKNLTTPEKQYKAARKTHHAALDEAEQKRVEALAPRTTPDISSFWIPRRATNTEIRA